MAHPADLDDQDQAPVLPWRLVAGGFLHFGIVGYLLVVPALALLEAPRSASAEQILRLALRYSAAFLLGLFLIGTLATLSARLLDPLLRARRHGRSRSPEAAAGRSRERLRRAAGIARGGLSADTSRLVAQVAAEPWDHDDPRYQALARDLEEVIATSSAAIASAAADQATELEELAVRAIGQIRAELVELAASRAREEEVRARTAAHYVSSRYGTFDSTIRPG